MTDFILDSKYNLKIYNYKLVRNSNPYLNQEIAYKNLVLFSNFLINHKIYHGIIYGTLLGLYREEALIKHDQDVDLYILDEDKDKLLNSLQFVEDIGFKVIRFEKKLISIFKDGEYIDMYLFSKFFFKFRKCGRTVIKASYLENPSSLDVKGFKFKVPSPTEQFLIQCYGKDWRQPKKDCRQQSTSNLFTLIFRFFGIPRKIFKIFKNILKKYI